MKSLILLMILFSSFSASAQWDFGFTEWVTGVARDIGLIRDENDTRRVPDPIMERIITQQIEHYNTVVAKRMEMMIACMEEYAEAKRTPRALQGARKLMATMYQSCDAPFITVPNTTNMVSSPVAGRPRALSDSNRVARYRRYNPYLENRTSVRPGCFNVLNQPPIYGYGAKPGLRNGLIDLHENQASRPHCPVNGVSCSSRPVSAIDCSGFVTAAMRRMGLNMNPNVAFHPDQVNTARLNEVTGGRNSCLGFVQINQEVSIQPGDLINIGSNHVVMVDEVGEDPLGIKKHLRNNSCRRLSKADFDFRFLHSGSLAHFGVARAQATHPEMRGFMTALEVKARQACNALKQGRKRVELAHAASSNQLGVIRHAGDKIPGCVGREESFANESCINGCRNL